MLTIHKNNLKIIREDILPTGERVAVISCVKDGIKIFVLVKILPGGQYEVVGIKKASEKNNIFSGAESVFVLAGDIDVQTKIKPLKKSKRVESPFVPNQFLFWNSQKTRAPTASF